MDSFKRSSETWIDRERPLRLLILSRKTGESVRLRVGSEDVWVRLLALDRNKAKIAFLAPDQVEIKREEIIQCPNT